MDPADLASRRQSPASATTASSSLAELLDLIGAAKPLPLLSTSLSDTSLAHLADGILSSMATPVGSREPASPMTQSFIGTGSTTPLPTHISASPCSFRTSSTVSEDMDAIDALFGVRCPPQHQQHSAGGVGLDSSPTIAFDSMSAGTMAQCTAAMQSPIFAASAPHIMALGGQPITSMGDAGYSLMPSHERRVLRRHMHPASHPYLPRLSHVAQTDGPMRRNSAVMSSALTRPRPARSNTCIIPAINQDGSYKCCANCMTATTPSWRRHPETQELLCNACGLYLRLHRKSRPITLDDSGQVQVIRKNAAVQREPINLPSAPLSTSGTRPATHMSLPGPPVSALGCQPLRTNTTLAAMQEIGATYQLVDLAYSPTLSTQHNGVHFVSPMVDTQNVRFINDIMHMNILDIPTPLSAPLDGAGRVEELCAPKAEGLLPVSQASSPRGYSPTGPHPNMPPP